MDRSDRLPDEQEDLIQLFYERDGEEIKEEVEPMAKHSWTPLQYDPQFVVGITKKQTCTKCCLEKSVWFYKSGEIPDIRYYRGSISFGEQMPECTEE